MVPHVVVVGAGLAGLKCAQVLVRSGAFEVTIIESGERVGGRVLTCRREDGGVVEVGAQWIHGTEGNPLVDLVKRSRRENGEEERSVNEEKKIIGLRRVVGSRLSGKPLSNEELFDNAWRWTSRKLQECVGAEELSVGDYVRARIDGSKGDEYVACCEHRLKWERTISACGDVSELHLASWGEYYERRGPHLRVRRGYDTIAELLAHDALGTSRPASFWLGRRVSKVVSRSKNKVRVIGDEESPMMDADHVVVTASLGALQRGLIDFEPPLDEKTSTAIERLGFGFVEKVGVSFSDKWWTHLGMSGEWHGVNMNDEDGLDEVFGDAATSWRHDPTIRGAPTVVGWLAGRDAEALQDIDDDVILRAAVRAIATLSGLTRDDARLSSAKLALRSRWAAEPHCGSYSFVKVGSSGDDFDALASVKERCPGLSLAGEHTHRTRYSTADGALLSGERTALELLIQTVEPPFACVLLKRADGKFLAELRNDKAKVAANQLTCFGGKRELGETAAQCASREIAEELGVDQVPLEPATWLIVNGVLIASFFVSSAAMRLNGDMMRELVLEEGVRAVWADPEDPRWTPWHRAVLDAYCRGESFATFCDDNLASTLSILRRLPTARDYATIVNTLQT